MKKRKPPKKGINLEKIFNLGISIGTFIISLIILYISLKNYSFTQSIYSGEPYIIDAGSLCINVTEELNHFLKARCNELSLGEVRFIPLSTLSQFTDIPEGAIIEAKLDRESVGVCKFFYRCIYPQKTRENFIIIDHVNICIIRNKTNETVCYSS